MNPGRAFPMPQNTPSPRAMHAQDPAEAGLAHLPPGNFMANAAWLALAVMAHNLGRAVGLLLRIAGQTKITPPVYPPKTLLLSDNQ
jgi:hypothetical protein